MKILKKLFMGFVTIIIILMCMGFSTGAKQEVLTCGDYDYIILEDSTACIVKYNGTETKSLEMPDELDGRIITDIYSPALSSAEDVERVRLPSNLRKIRAGVFFYFSNLTDIVIPDSVEYIETNAFEYCHSLERITIPGSVRLLDGPFENCRSLKELIICEGTEIVIDSLECVNLRYISLPSTVKKVVIYSGFGKVVKYAGMQQQWDAVVKDANLERGIKNGKIKIHFSNHSTERRNAKIVSCDKDGYTSGVYCNDCKEWVEGHYRIVSTFTHSFEQDFDYEDEYMRRYTCIYCPETKYIDIGDIKPSVPEAKQTSSTITLSWDRILGADGYRVYTYNSETKKYTKLADLTDTTYTVKKLSSGTKYSFAIKAYAYDGEKRLSKISDVLTTATKPATPTLKLTSTSKGKANISWSNVSGETGYQVWYCTSKNGKYVKLSNYKANTVKATASKLTSGKIYYFKVRAYKKAGGEYVYSNFGSVKSVKIK